MKYPKEVQEQIAVLDTYAEDNSLKSFHILHLYPKGLAYPHGYHDSRVFELWAFNYNTMTKINLGKHDGMVFNRGIQIDIARIFADGSTFLRFLRPIEVEFRSQAIQFKETTK